MDIQAINHTAAEMVRAELEKPQAEERIFLGEDTFDPWALFPCLYGSYSSEFDDMALLVLRNLEKGFSRQSDDMEPGEGLAHEMFREILCNADLCEYGSSPRVCFATGEFGKLLPELIEKWRGYYEMQWGEG